MTESDDIQSFLNPDQPLGKRLVAARESAGFTQAELARRVGVELESIIAWESDQREPRASRIMNLCGVLGVSLKWMFQGIDANHENEVLIPKLNSEINRLKNLLAEASRVAGNLETHLNRVKIEVEK